MAKATAAAAKANAVAAAAGAATAAAEAEAAAVVAAEAQAAARAAKAKEVASIAAPAAPPPAAPPSAAAPAATKRAAPRSAKPAPTQRPPTAGNEAPVKPSVVLAKTAESAVNAGGGSGGASKLFGLVRLPRATLVAEVHACDDELQLEELQSRLGEMQRCVMKRMLQLRE